MPKNRARPRQRRRPAPPDPQRRTRRIAQGGPREPVRSSATGLRGRVERVSYPLLVRLSTGPRWLPAAIMAGLVIGGMAAPAVVGAVLLVLAALFVLWLTYLSWPVVPTSGRFLCGILLGLLVGGVVVRLTEG